MFANIQDYYRLIATSFIELKCINFKFAFLNYCIKDEFINQIVKTYNWQEFYMCNW